MSNLKLSIIAAAYNEGENIKNFLDFWLEQDYSNYEIIIVNDGSTDNTEKIVREYILKYGNKIILINNEKNKGIGYTRLNGYNHIQGDVIKFSDTDIAFDYPKQINLISRLMEPFNIDNQVDVVYINYYPYFDMSNIIRTLENFFYYSPVLKTPCNYETLKTPSYHMPTLFRYKNIDLSGVSKIKNGEDRYIAMKFLKESRKNSIANGNIILDVNNSTLKELFGRYYKYGTNSLGIIKSSINLFFFHLIKPLVIFFSIFLFIIGFIISNIIFLIPLLIIYITFLILTIIWGQSYYKNENILMLLKIIIYGPLFLMLRYLFIFCGIIVIIYKKIISIF